MDDALILIRLIASCMLDALEATLRKTKQLVSVYSCTMNPKYVSVILFTVSISIASGSSVNCDDKMYRSDLKRLANDWFDVGDVLQSFLYPDRVSIAGKLINSTDVPNVSLECRKAVHQVSRDLVDNKLWAIEMLDTCAAHSAGFLRRWVEFGDFDTCLDISNRESSSPGDILVDGQYCMVEVAFPLPHPSMRDSIEQSIDLSLSERHVKGHWLERGASTFKILYTHGLSFSFCSPSSCSPAELETIINHHLPRDVPIEARIDPLLCTSTKEKDVTPATLKRVQFAAQMVLLTLTSIVALSPLLLRYTWAPAFLHHFDIVSNTHKLYSPTNDPLASKLVWVHGARILYLALAISFHMILLSILWTPQTQSKFIFSKYSINFPLWTEFFSNMTIGISVNFTIGGMLTYVSWYPELIRMRGSLSLGKYILARWIRTLPLVAGAIIILLATPVTFASGPVWKMAWAKVVNNCLSNWWVEFIYASNVLPIRSSCLPYAWYLSVDMQLYLLSFLLLIVIFKSVRYGALIASVTCISAIIYHASYLHRHSLKYTADYNASDIERHLEKEIVLHVGSFNYISSYTIGIVLGYLITSGYKIESKVARTLGWIVFVSLGLSVHIIPLIWKANNGPCSRASELIFGALQRSVYSIAFSYGFLLGSNNQAGFLNSMANWSFITPLGRLSSSMFIGHFFVIWYETFTSRMSVQFDLFSLIKRFTTTFVFSLFIGYYIYAVFEAPLLNLGKSLISAHKRKKMADKIE